MRKTVLPSAGLLFLAACALEAKPELALACQTRPCTCLPETAGFPLKAEPAPVKWRSNGDAYCDEGYVLRLVEN